jgi:hypothetical protein
VRVNKVLDRAWNVKPGKMFGVQIDSDDIRADFEQKN